jgi:hypothetical protein
MNLKQGIPMKLLRLLFICSFIFTLSITAEESAQVGTHRVLQFENEHVKVWKTIIMPRQPLKMHRHDCSRVVVGLKGGSLTKIEDTGETSELKFETGKAYWLTEDPEGTLHADINESDESIEVMVIEIKEHLKN